MKPIFPIVASIILAAPVLWAQTTAKLAAKSQSAAKSAAAMPPAKPTAIFDTTAGKMTCTLFPDKAPNAVANFAGLATGTRDWRNPNTGKMQHGVPLYNGTIFHRVIPNFMIQGGDPLGTGMGGPGYQIKDEIVPGLNFDVPGRLAYANSGPDTNGSQFFITEVPVPHLNGHYVIFGQCDDATVELVKQIARRARDERSDRPFDPVKINSITILGIKGAAAPHKRRTPAAPGTHKKPPAKS